MNRIKIKAKCKSMLLAGTLFTTVLSTSGCGNKQVFDFNKSFNVAIETNNGFVSVVGIQEYADYEGSQVQFVTEDGLRVLTSTHKTQLVKMKSTEELEQYALSLCGNNEEKLFDYNAMQGVSVNTDESSWNKDIIDWNYTFHQAIILTDEKATIVDISQWKDYEKDDKIQLKLADGTCILTNIDRVKLLNCEEAKENSLENYAVSLVGSDENIEYYQTQKVKTK